MNGPSASLYIRSGMTKLFLVLTQCSLSRFVLPALCSAIPVGRKILPVYRLQDMLFC